MTYELDFDFRHGDTYVERTDRDQPTTRDVLYIDDEDAGAEEVRSAHIDLD